MHENFKLSINVIHQIKLWEFVFVKYKKLRVQLEIQQQK